MVAPRMRALYISQNGMAENLGQSQVLPYLRGLVARGAEIDVVSFELASLPRERRDELGAELAREGMRWHPLVRTMGTSLPVKLMEAAKGVDVALRTSVRRRPDIIHGRSYFASAIGDAIRLLSPRSKLLFDCRGMIGDEYIDAGHWTADRLEYRLVKRYEKRLFARADGVVVLTRALAEWLRERGAVPERLPLSVIPCCVDMQRFRRNEDARLRIRRELGFEDATVLVYAGSLGTWYREAEMARFIAAAKARARRVAFLCLTHSDSTSFKALLTENGLSAEEMVIRRVPPRDMPDWLSVADIGLSFIQSSFSKKGSSPTKVAEYLACGNVAVLNGDIGDQADLKSERESCVVLDDFSDASIARALDRALALAGQPTAERVASTVSTARRHFGLEEVGVSRYLALYEALVSTRTA